MSLEGQKYIRREDLDKIRELAKMLNEEYSPKRRMDIQQTFVKEMTVKYNHETATLLLTRAWKLADRIRAREESYV